MDEEGEILKKGRCESSLHLFTQPEGYWFINKLFDALVPGSCISIIL